MIMIRRAELNDYLDTYLNCPEFNDLGPNGLQVEGKESILKIITAVSAGVELFEKAKEKNADAVLVHHGIIWNFERPVYRGGYKQRVKLLLENEINLFAYHLPLDAHQQVGNNAEIARILGLNNIQPFGEYNGQYVGFKGELPGIEANAFFKLVKEKINPNLISFPFGPDKIYKVGIISGGAQKDVKQAVEEELDLFLTGEASEHILNYVKEEKIHFISAGHYATERFGVLALGKHLEKQFDVDVEFIDIPNPV